MTEHEHSYTPTRTLSGTHNRSHSLKHALDKTYIEDNHILLATYDEV